MPQPVTGRTECPMWRPENVRRMLGVEVPLCDDDHVKSIEVNGRLIAQGRELFPYGR